MLLLHSIYGFVGIGTGRAGDGLPAAGWIPHDSSMFTIDCIVSFRVHGNDDGRLMRTRRSGSTRGKGQGRGKGVRRTASWTSLASQRVNQIVTCAINCYPPHYMAYLSLSLLPPFFLSIFLSFFLSFSLSFFLTAMPQ